ncbi:hypothetical protein ACHAXH_000477, partial [Discostella pseudostelligera]
VDGTTPSGPPKRRPFSKALALPLLIISISAVIGSLNFRWRTELRSAREYISSDGGTNGGWYNYNNDDDDDDDEASVIIRKSYEQTYAYILPCDEDAPFGKQCMNKTMQYFNPNNKNINREDIPSIPWWFQTLLRDMSQNGAFGSWHHFSTTTPPLNFCSIEKVGTTEWRRVFCKLNADDCQPDPVKQCGRKQCAWQTMKDMPDDAPWAVFLRDPLERLLSGFLDKCYSNITRKIEHHCEPNVIFNPAPRLKDVVGKGYPSLVDQVIDNDKQYFAAYVDVLPLKWNLHFIPQAIACDLHRRFDEFSFVGNMGEDFMFELERMADQFGGGPLADVVNSTFNYMEFVKLQKKNTGNVVKRHSTHAPAKVQKFYTAHAVRRALEYLSIDYMLLGLEVPEWARQMLRDDVS